MNEEGKGPAYRIETERLIIRCWSPDDASVLRAALDRSDQHLRPWIPFMKDEPRSLEETAEWLRGKRADFDRDVHYRLATFARDGTTLLGETGLYARVGDGALEVGYWIDIDHQGRGFATESTMAMVKVAFEVNGVDRVDIYCSPNNAASVAIPAKLGFSHEATLKRRFEDSEGEIHDSMIWCLYASEYPATPSSEIPLTATDCRGARLL